MSKCKIIFWLDICYGFANFHENLLLKEISGYVEIKMYNPVEEAKGTVWEKYYRTPKRFERFS